MRLRDRAASFFAGWGICWLIILAVLVHAVVFRTQIEDELAFAAFARHSNHLLTKLRLVLGSENIFVGD
jgi:hypothetical protein